MNKKGFTLVEILGIVVILGLLFLIVAPPVINSVSKHESEITNAQKQMIEDAADLYLDSHTISGTCITIGSLISSGYLSDENGEFKSATDKALGTISFTKIIDNQTKTYYVKSSC